MGVLIVLGTIGLVIGIARRTQAPVAFVPPMAAPIAAVLDEPAGTHIVGIAVLPGPLEVFSARLDVHTLLYAGAAVVVGFQAVLPDFLIMGAFALLTLLLAATLFKRTL